jgi:hypothetical protein
VSLRAILNRCTVIEVYLQMGPQPAVVRLDERRLKKYSGLTMNGYTLRWRRGGMGCFVCLRTGPGSPGVGRERSRRFDPQGMVPDGIECEDGSPKRCVCDVLKVVIPPVGGGG